LLQLLQFDLFGYVAVRMRRMRRMRRMIFFF